MKKAVGNSKKSSQATLTSFFSRQGPSTSLTLQDKTSCQLGIKVNNVQSNNKRQRSPSKSPAKTTSKRTSSRKTPSPSKKIEQFFTPDLIKARVTSSRVERAPVENVTIHSKDDECSDDDIVFVSTAPKTPELRRSPRLQSQVNGLPNSPIKSCKKNKVKNKLFSPAKNGHIENCTFAEESFHLDKAFFEDFEPFEACPPVSVVENLNLAKLDRYKVENCTRLAGGDFRMIVKNMVNATSGSCLVKSPWNACIVQEGDLVSLKGKLIEGEGWVIEWSGVLVSNPDNLISGTSVVGSLFCMRKAVLSEFFEEIGEKEAKYLVIGSVVHQLLQEVLRKKIRDREGMEKICEGIVSDRDFIVDLFLQNVQFSETVDSIKSYLPKIYGFVETYIAGNKVQRLAPKEPENWQGEIVAVRDIEENIWSSGLGIKGKIDATVLVKVNNKSKVMPLELKTGKVSFSMEHRGQVILYCMLLKELGEFVDSGLLLYLKDQGGMKEIPAGEREVRDLILLRNCLSQSLLDLSNISPSESIQLPQLPPPINRRSCESCGHLIACSAGLRQQGLDELGAGNRLKRLAPQMTNHLTDKHLRYIFHWIGLQSLENGTSKFNLSKLWNEEPQKREERGACLTDLTVISSSVTKNSRFEIVFAKYDGSVFDDVFDTGQTVIISSHTQIAIAFGFVTSTSPSSLTLSTEKYLKTNEGLFILDCYESQAAKKTMVKNMSLLLEDSGRARILREAIIDLKLPTFSTKLSGKIRKIGFDIFEKLNKEQVRSLLQAISADTYILIQGMPGTGKTTTMRALIELMVRLGKTVLVSSFTHSAVDNILVGLVGKIDMMRIVNPNRVHPKLKDVTERAHLNKLDNPSAERLEAMYKSKKVIGVSCLSATHPWLERQVFDVCLVDEASQVTIPAVLRPLLLAKKFILVGDPKQLPPLVVNQNAGEYGLRKSLFHLLDRPAVTTKLTQQYRMNQQITDLANGFAYDNQLRCGSDTVANATLHYPQTPTCQEPWITLSLSQRLEDSVVVVDVKTDDNTSSSKVNRAEANVITRITQEMISVGVADSSIGVIAAYREQVDFLSKRFDGAKIETSTVDQYQGRDKDVILFTCSKTCRKVENDILADTNRLTVAITRAKRKLILVCDVDFVRSYDNFAKLFAHVPPSNFVSIASN